MSITASAGSPATTRPNTRQKAGLAIAALYGLSNIPSVLEGPDAGEAGPPMSILVVSSILGLVGLVAAIWAWRGGSRALRVAAGAMILETVTGLPAFFVDVPSFIKVLVAVSVLITVVAVVLMFSGERRGAALD